MSWGVPFRMTTSNLRRNNLSLPVTFPPEAGLDACDDDHRRGEMQFAHTGEGNALEGCRHRRNVRNGYSLRLVIWQAGASRIII